MQSKATTVKEYLAGLPEDRREAIEAVRAVILKNLDKQFQEGMQYGMIGYSVPHSVYPAGYHCDPKQPVPFAGLASQKNYMSLYLMCVYGAPEHEAWFREAWARTGKKLDMGKGCIRFKKLEDLPLDVIGQTIKRVPAKKFLAQYEAMLGAMGRKPRAKAAEKASDKSSPARKAPVKKGATAKTAKKEAPAGRAAKKAPARQASAKKAGARKSPKR